MNTGQPIETLNVSGVDAKRAVQDELKSRTSPNAFAGSHGIWGGGAIHRIVKHGRITQNGERKVRGGAAEIESEQINQEARPRE